MSSSIPVTVTVCGVSQLLDVNVRVLAEVPLTWASVVSDEVTVTTTLSPGAGCMSSTTVNVSVLPDEASLTDVDPPVWVTVRPGAASMSVVVTDTVWLSTESKSSSELPSLTDSVAVEVWLPSSE